jgi:hypothetical protein
MTECKPTSTVASARIARFIQETLPKFELVDTKEKATVCWDDEVAGKLIIVNGPMAFCDFLPELAKLVEIAKKVIWVQQDYTIMPPGRTSKAESPFRKIFADLNLRPDFWTTVKNNVVTQFDRYINWNKLTYKLEELPALSITPVLMYYGAYREKRQPMFKKYFGKESYETIISTTPIRGKKFKLYGVNGKVTIVPPFTSLSELPECSATIYIEDPKSSIEFHSPANRFYEMISAGIPIFFDYFTIPMLAKAGIVPKEKWIVNDPESIHSKMNFHDLQIMQQEQREMWAKEYKTELKKELLAAWNS